MSKKGQVSCHQIKSICYGWWYCRFVELPSMAFNWSQLSTNSCISYANSTPIEATIKKIPQPPAVKLENNFDSRSSGDVETLKNRL